MVAVVVQQLEATVHIPAWVTDLASFRRWATSEEFPTQGWYSHLNGELWVDSNMERLAHNKIKSEFGGVLGPLVKQAGSGYFLVDRMLLTNVEAELSTEPDGMFISSQAQRKGHVRLERGEDSVEVEGSPDMVLEVVSPTSAPKDTVVLRDLYRRAGVREYWLADARREDVAFDILRRGPKRFATVRKQGRWAKSSVFQQSFRLTRGTDPLGHPAYALDVR